MPASQSLGNFLSAGSGGFTGIFSGKIGGEENATAHFMRILRSIILILEYFPQILQYLLRVGRVVDLLIEKVAHVINDKCHCATVQTSR
jgi:nucleoside permease NupC